jgi:hypothetical protein
MAYFASADIVDVVLRTGVWLPLLVLFAAVALYLLHWWETRPVNKCPRCKTKPPVVDVRNVCWDCGCEYDRWGNLLKDPPPPQSDGLPLPRFDANRQPMGSDDRYHRPGLTEEPPP